ncbi:MAG: hypothetical protein ACLFNT_08235 [Spirochaetales bacterium]
MKLFVFHYHLRPGGVTEVIVNSLRAVAAAGEVSEIELLCGDDENRAEAEQAVREGVGSTAVRSEFWNELGYADQNESRDEVAQRVARLLVRIDSLDAAPSDLLWIHNYHLGKNASLTLAVLELSRRPAATTPRLLLHIHDFPEDGRYANLGYLRTHCGHELYPRAEHLRYAVINARDHRLLRRAGVSDRELFYLPNPVTLLPGTAEERRPHRDRLVTGLAAFAREKGYRFHTEAPIVLYPIRAIRRKNVVEIATIARMLEWNLIVTLAGTSSTEAAYSQMVEYAFTDRRVHGLFGIGRQEHRFGISFEDLTHGADLIASSSVQEGFGLSFVNALSWQVPLLARNLEVVDGIRSMFDGYPALFYDHFLVPLSSPSLKSMRSYLGMRYGERIEAIAEAAPAVVERIENEITEMLDGESIDFSYLPAQMQLTILGDIRDEAFAAEVHALNQPVLEAAAALVGTPAPDRREVVESQLGPAAFAARFRKVTASYDAAAGEGTPARGEASRGGEVASRFATREAARLLLGPMDH